ncbi:ADP-ribosylation factor-like protein 2-binding protein [Physeter macrocephalus]|uniref:ADP-ribosylation factor-like protein 2-binding protein n=1 Tax=Physeter macrocephalus TaxID=9755 RepID=A0A9W2WZ53_PHYMC|nr:ADP-ribosylation factor-like protein 2-binding protein [Physeter catodon]
MDALEEESFALSISSASDAEFDAVVGYLEDIIMDDEFQLLQRNFMDKYYQEFEDTEENKLTYTPIFNEYISLVEKYIEQLLERIPGFNMATFTTTLQHHKDEVAGFPGGAVVARPPADAGEPGSRPGLGGSHMPRSGWAREPWPLGLYSATGEATTV